MNIVSLFDGHGGGRIALDKLAVNVSSYRTSEIDKYASAVACYNHPEHIAMGDVRDISSINELPVDAIIGGSPCTDLSFSGNQKGLGTDNISEYLKLKSRGYAFKGQSYLFWEYMRLIKEAAPDWFLLENVRMSKVNESIMSEHIGFEPIVFDSNVLSAQNRHRLYWIGRRNNQGGYDKIEIKVPNDTHIIMRDILHEYNDEQHVAGLSDYIVPLSDKIIVTANQRTRGAKIGFYGKDSQANRFYSTKGKGITLTGNSGGGAAKMGQYFIGDIDSIYNNAIHVPTRQGGEVLIDGYIRKLTPVEAERMQTLDDDTTKYGLFDDGVREISDTQRYAMTGNGWTNKVIQSIISQVLDQ